MAKGLAGVDAHSPCRGADGLLREELCPPLGAKTAVDGQTDAPDKGLRQNEGSTRWGRRLASSSQRPLLLAFPVGSEDHPGRGRHRTAGSAGVAAQMARRTQRAQHERSRYLGRQWPPAWPGVRGSWAGTPSRCPGREHEEGHPRVRLRTWHFLKH